MSKKLRKKQERMAKQYLKRFRRQEKQWLNGHNSRFTMQGKKPA